ncbi:glycosylphosphatidylinositol anchor biosynthesis [Knufia fluminis]|uniref:Mannosyltransferase n=1 Tax=Knufia fluminis TaxID=191047 RepID=A0AAN8ER55_9EURO|nr:glycosylphosphatidylinositol anchor biosynthesis [Knufia fluminis]
MPITPTSSSSTGGCPADVLPDVSRKKSSGSFIADNLLLILIAYRLVNALSIRTFFQPDEYYQSLEPAWWLAFGDSSGPWITWEWKNHLRSALHPALFAAIYRCADAISAALHLTPPARSVLLLAAPKTVQAIVAAIGDYYTVKLSYQVYGRSSYPAWCTIWLTVGSAWNWFISTRSFSNCLETTLTIVALYNWPFHWALGTDEVGFQVDRNVLRVRQRSTNDTASANAEKADVDETTRLRRSIFCASLAVILRPTNAIIWIILVVATFGRGIWHHGMHWEIGAFIKEGLICGSTVLALSGLVDRIFYDVWTFPLWHFFKFNVLQSLAVFYGNNNWHYYLSQGYPLLLIGAIVHAGLGLFYAIANRHEPSTVSIQSRLILHRLALVSLTLPAALSILSHKEVRFIYPVLPALHVLAAHPLSRILGYPDTIGKARIASPVRSNRIRNRIFIAVLIVINITVAHYTSLVHNAGLISVTDYLRNEFETHYLPQTHTYHPPASEHTTIGKNLTFAVLAPCHSIPWRSHLQYPPTEHSPGISGWALTCEPPLNLNATAKQTYMDEADQFYDDPVLWLKTHMSRDVPLGPKAPGVYAKQDDHQFTNPDRGVFLEQGEGGKCVGGKEARSMKSARECQRRAWPDYLVFFGQLEPLMRRVLEGSQYAECERLFNSHAHDDWRRSGDVVVWCLRPGGAGTESKKSGGIEGKREL